MEARPSAIGGGSERRELNKQYVAANAAPSSRREAQENGWAVLRMHCLSKAKKERKCVVVRQ